MSEHRSNSVIVSGTVQGLKKERILDKNRTTSLLKTKEFTSVEETEEEEEIQKPNLKLSLNVSGNSSLSSSRNHIFDQSFKRQSTKIPNLRNHTTMSIEPQKSNYKPKITSKELKNYLQDKNTDSEKMEKTINQLEYYENKLQEEQSKYLKLIKGSFSILILIQF
jgi:hypothetical protein